MRNIWYFVCILGMLAAAVFAAGCTVNIEPAPAAQTPAPTPLPTVVPTAAPTAVPEVGQGGTLDVDAHGNHLRFTILDRKFDDQANELLKRGGADQNPVPGTGEKAVLLKIQTEFISGKDAAVTLWPDSYELYVNGKGYDVRSAQLPPGFYTFKKVNILPGAKDTSWFVFIVPNGNEKFGYDINEAPLGFIRVDY